MKKAALYPYTLLVPGWLTCLQYDDTAGMNVLTAYLSAFLVKKSGTLQQDAQLIRTAAGGVIRTFCSNTGSTAFYTARVNGRKLAGSPVIIRSYKNHFYDRPFCCNK